MNHFFSKQTLVGLLMIGVLSAAVVVISGQLSTRKNLTEQRSQAAGSAACEVQLTIVPPGPITPTQIVRPSVFPTPVICQQNVDVALVLDRSSSMNKLESDGRSKLEWAKDAAREFVNSIQRSGKRNIRISVSSFGAQGNDGTGTRAREYDSILHINLSADYNAVKKAIDNVKYIKSGTCVQCGIRIGNQTNQTSPNLKAQILISDGKANREWNGSSSASPKKLAIAEANVGRGKGITYFVMGYGLKSKGEIDEATLLAIAGNPQNYVYKPDVKDWSKTFLEILSKICVKPTPTIHVIPLTPTPVRPSNTPTTGTCRTCNYQLDAFWGPVIKSFANGDRYSRGVDQAGKTVRRLISAVADLPTATRSSPNPVCKLDQAPILSKVVIPATARGCENPVENKLLTAVWDVSKLREVPTGLGLAFVTISNRSRGCTYKVGAASYKANWSAPGDQINPQNIVEYKEGVVLAAGRSVKLALKVGTNNDRLQCHAPIPLTTAGVVATVTPTRPPTAAGAAGITSNGAGLNQAEAQNVVRVPAYQGVSSATDGSLLPLSQEP